MSDPRTADPIAPGDLAAMKVLQERLAQALQVGKIGNWELDLSDGSMWWSDECYELFRVSRDSFNVKAGGIEPFVHPLDRGNYRRLATEAWARRAVADIEFRILTPDGETRWIHAQGRPFQGETSAENEHRRVGIFQDITERKRRDQSLMLLLHAVQHINDLVMVFACEGDMRVCTTVFANAPLLALVGDTQQAGDVAQAFFANLKPTQAETAAIESALAQRRGIRQEVVALDSECNPVWLDLDLSPMHASAIDSELNNLWIGIGRDNTESHTARTKNAQLLKEVRALNRELESQVALRTAELAHEKAQYEVLAENAPQIIWRYEVGVGLTYCNQSGMALLGKTFEELAGHGFQALLHPDDRQHVMDSWRQSVKTGRHFTGYRRQLDASGQYRTMSYNAAPIHRGSEAPTIWIGIDTDITEIKKVEAELRETNAQLEAFSYSVSHDLRSPLSLIDGFSSLLQRNLEASADEKSRHYLQRIRKATAHMAQLIDDMLSLAKVTKAEAVLKSVDVSQIADEIVDRLAAREPGRRAAVTVQPDLLALADERLLRITLDNLIGNAWKFTSKNAETKIEVGRLADGCTFFVRDNGVGFDETQAKRLFGVFQRLHKESDFPGTGIGLATVHRIVTRHGGKLWAESQRGKGTTFFFTLSPDSAVPA